MNPASNRDIFISLPAQTLELYEKGLLLHRYSVSTAKNGVGEQNGSYCTPRGKHIIRAKIGAGCRENSVFVRRRPTGEIWTPDLASRYPDRDWILTRILWLSGMQPGFNRLGTVDTMRRYIYLHGSPDAVPMGKTGSIGCIRMRNRDIIELYDRVHPYTPVNLGDYRIETGAWLTLAPRAQTLREPDEFDPDSLHALASDAAGKAIGTGRLLTEGQIGRMAVSPEWRNQGVGTAIVRYLLEAAGSQGIHQVFVNAQTSEARFYSRFGFSPAGVEFTEAESAYVQMRVSLRV